MRRSNNYVFAFGLTYFIFWLLVVVACAYGWIHNVLLMASHLDNIDSLELVRIAGVAFAPLGVILGWIG